MSVASFTKKLIATLVIGAAAMAPASATVFTITDAVLTKSAGYGNDGGENGSQLLDVRFSNAFVLQDFDLSAVDAFKSFKIGTIAFWETDAGNGANAGIKSQEIDDLGVNAAFTFSAPGAFSRNLNAIGTATTGLVSDNAVDFMLNFESLNIKFGNSGLFNLSIASQSFSTIDNRARDLMATLTLVELDKPVVPEVPVKGDSPKDPGKVPEPGSLALLAAAVAAIGAARRKQA